MRYIAMRNKKNSKRGFTLIEIVFAVVVIAILATIAVPSVSGVLNNANRAVDNANAGLYESALKIYVSQKAQIKEYVYIDDTLEKRSRVANSIALVIGDDTVKFKGKTRNWSFYYHPITLQIVAMEYSGIVTASGMVALVDSNGEALTGNPDGPLL